MDKAADGNEARFSNASDGADPLDWDFLDPRNLDSMPEPSDFCQPDDFEDWLEDF